MVSVRRPTSCHHEGSTEWTSAPHSADARFFAWGRLSAERSWPVPSSAVPTTMARRTPARLPRRSRRARHRSSRNPRPSASRTVLFCQDVPLPGHPIQLPAHLPHLRPLLGRRSPASPPGPGGPSSQSTSRRSPTPWRPCRSGPRGLHQGHRLGLELRRELPTLTALHSDSLQGLSGPSSGVRQSGATPRLRASSKRVSVSRRSPRVASRRSSPHRRCSSAADTRPRSRHRMGATPHQACRWRTRGTAAPSYVPRERPLLPRSKRSAPRQPPPRRSW